jgi:zinc transporter ZupT
MLLTISLYALATALATGLGALPFLFIKNPTEKVLSWGNVIAAGCMLGASALLIREGVNETLPGLLIGAGIGALFIIITQRVLRDHHDVSIASLKGASARQALLIIGVMTVHSFTEGIGIGVSFGDTMEFGVLIAIAMAIHNIPEGLAISLILIPRGASIWQAIGWSIFSSIPQVLMAVPAFLFIEQFRALLAPGLGFAAGAMIFMCFSELIPEARKNLSRTQVSTGAIIAGTLLFALELVL